jgi:hypothetical protein
MDFCFPHDNALCSLAACRPLMRRDKLQKLRAAVEALEADAAEGRLGSARRK